MDKKKNIIRELVPQKILRFGLLFWLITYLLAPFTHVDLGNSVFYAIISLTFFNIALFSGMSLKVPIKRNFPYNHDILKIKKLTIILIIFGLIGDILRFIQRSNSNISISSLQEDMLAVREATLEAGELSGGVLSVVAALLFPFGTMALLLAIYFKKDLNKYIFIVAIPIGIYPVIDGIMLGGRSSVLMLSTVFIFAYLLKLQINHDYINYVQFKVKRKILFCIPKKIFSYKVLRTSLVLFIIIISFFVVVATQRQSGNSVSELIPTWEKYRGFDLNNTAVNIIEKSENGMILMAFIELFYYIDHGFFEYLKLFDLLYLRNSLNGIYYGKYEFYIFPKFLKIFGVDIGMDSSTMNDVSFHKSGIFTTFWGPVLVDFGVFWGTIYAFIVGYVTKIIYVRAAFDKRIFALLFYPFLASTIFSSFVIHSMADSNIYYLVSAVISSIIYYLIKQF